MRRKLGYPYKNNDIGMVMVNVMCMYWLATKSKILSGNYVIEHCHAKTITKPFQWNIQNIRLTKQLFICKIWMIVLFLDTSNMHPCINYKFIITTENCKISMNS